MENCCVVIILSIKKWVNIIMILIPLYARLLVLVIVKNISFKSVSGWIKHVSAAHEEAKAKFILRELYSCRSLAVDRGLFLKIWCRLNVFSRVD